MDKPPAVVIEPGFRPLHRQTAARLFWEAFRDKLAPVMKPETRALAFLSRAVDPNHAISAVSADGRLLGIAGYKTARGGLVGGGLGDLCASYGLFGGFWRAVALSALDRAVEPGTLLMDGIFVSAATRGQGVGTALLTAIKQKARELGCTTVRLDVIDANPRARALYERQGFVAQETSGAGPFRYIFGFRSSTRMIYMLQAKGPHTA